MLWTRELHSLTQQVEAWLDGNSKFALGNELSLTDFVLAALYFSFLDNKHNKADRMRKFAEVKLKECPKMRAYFTSLREEFLEVLENRPIYKF